VLGQASIFLVEDEVLIRMMLADMVEELGHRVVAEAGNVQDARALAETIFFDIAILDINIAGSSIAPVATIIARRGLPFFFVSGYGQKRSLNDQRCKSRCRYQSSARQLTRSSRPLVRHRPALTTLRRIFNEPHRPPHHMCMALIAVGGDLEFARALNQMKQAAN